MGHREGLSSTVLIDSSAWIEYLRATGSQVHLTVRRLVSSKVTIATTDVVMLELLAGADQAPERRRIQALLNRCRFLAVRPLFEYEEAAILYARCRRAGVTPRSLVDCLIAAVAIRTEVPLLHADRDFDVIARHTSLRLM